MFALATALARVPLRTPRTGLEIFWQSRRSLNLLEHQSMTLLREKGVNVPQFGVARTVEEAKGIVAKMGEGDFVVKAQVLAGGRGKGTFENGLRGGVKIAFSADQAVDIASKMLGQYLVTKQTTGRGVLCEEVMITERLFIRKEHYFAIMLERESGGPLIVASSSGGMDIEDVAQENPEDIIKIPVDIREGLSLKEAEALAKVLGFWPESLKQAAQQMVTIYNAFIEKDGLLFEFNPFVEDKNHNIVVVDVKCSFDDNADFRQPEIFAKRATAGTNPREEEARKHHLNYITMDGDIGCMVNGAGLAMATMDIIKLHGRDPANFLDVGGGATADQVSQALRIITSDPQVHAILINIFGGIMRCDIVAQGIVQAASSLNLKIPLVVRLHGTRVDDAKAIFLQSDLRVLFCQDLEEASNLIAKMVAILGLAKEASVDISFELPI